MSICVSDMFNAIQEAYNAYGLGISSWGHVLSAGSMWNVWNLAKNEGISNRPTESGSRWQTSGTFAIGEDGRVKWGGKYPSSGLLFLYIARFG